MASLFEGWYDTRCFIAICRSHYSPPVGSLVTLAAIFRRRMLYFREVEGFGRAEAMATPGGYFGKVRRVWAHRGGA
jgi:hypothetical protein